MKRIRNNNVEIEKLNGLLSKRILNSDNIHIGDFISVLNYDDKKIENKYIVASISKFSGHNVRIKCYDIVKGGFLVAFENEEIKYLLRPNDTDAYKYLFNIPYTYSFNIGDFVKFIKPIDNTCDNSSNTDIFTIKRAYTSKHGCILVDLVNDGRYSLHNVPLVFLEKVNTNEEVKQIDDDLKLIKYNLNNKEVLKEKNNKEKNNMVDLIDEDKKVNDINGYSIEVVNVPGEDQKIICIIDLSKEIEVARFTLDKNDNFTNKIIKEYINKIIFA